MINPILFKRFLEHAGHHIEVSTYALPDGDEAASAKTGSKRCNQTVTLLA